MTETDDILSLESINEVVVTRRIIGDKCNNTGSYERKGKCTGFKRQRLARLEQRLARLVCHCTDSAVPSQEAVFKGKDRLLIIEALRQRQEASPESYEAAIAGHMLGEACMAGNVMVDYSQPPVATIGTPTQEVVLLGGVLSMRQANRPLTVAY